MQFFQRVYDQMPGTAVILFAVGLAAIVLLLGYDWLARRRENERKAEARADAEWDEQVRAKVAGAGKAPPDIEPVSRETRKAPLRRKNTRRKVRHK